MYRVSFKYINKVSDKFVVENNLGHKGGFTTEQEADKWVKQQKELGNIKPLKLLIWNEDIQCFSSIKTY